MKATLLVIDGQPDAPEVLRRLHRGPGYPVRLRSRGLHGLTPADDRHPEESVAYGTASKGDTVAKYFALHKDVRESGVPIGTRSPATLRRRARRLRADHCSPDAHRRGLLPSPDRCHRSLQGRKGQGIVQSLETPSSSIMDSCAPSSRRSCGLVGREKAVSMIPKPYNAWLARSGAVPPRRQHPRLLDQNFVAEIVRFWLAEAKFSRIRLRRLTEPKSYCCSFRISARISGLHVPGCSFSTPQAAPRLIARPARLQQRDGVVQADRNVIRTEAQRRLILGIESSSRPGTFCRAFARR